MRLASLSDSSALRERTTVLVPQSLRRASHCLAAAVRPAAETQYQCKLRLPPASEASVAIIGGGVSGACLAAALGERGVCCTVFDTGKHGAGGRCATRDGVQVPRGLGFDHGAQYFTCEPGSAFATLVQRWQAAGVVREWRGALHTAQRGTPSVPLRGAQTRWVAVDGFRHLVEHILRVDAPTARLRRPCWVDAMRPNASGRGRAWTLLQGGCELDSFDVVVIAHNGKCANRLLRPSGAPLVDAQMGRLKLSAIWCTLAAFERPLGAPFEAAYVANTPALSWAANNSKKLGLDGSTECWTLFSTAAYGRANKVPQENVPVDVSDRVATQMIAALAAAAGVDDVPPVAYSRTQLWGAAVPLNSPRVPCIFDGEARVGMCGDWLLGSSVQSAACSALGMAELIAGAYEARAGDDNLVDLSVGLNSPFVPVGGHDIGTAEGASRAGRVYTSRGGRR